MNLWKDDAQLFQLAKDELFTAVVGDTLDKLGYLNQFLPQSIKPLNPSMVTIGRAMPVLEADANSTPQTDVDSSILHQPFGVMFEALDNLKEHEVYICSGASFNYALWGGLMSTRAMKLKSAGAVLHGYSRDTNEILKLNFPTFSAGTYAQDQGPRGQVIDYRIPIRFGDILINPGDIIYGDRDGVVVVPKEIEKEAFEGAIEKVRGENLVRDALEKGMSTVDAFNTFGIM